MLDHITFVISAFEYICCLDGVKVILEPECRHHTLYDAHNLLQKCYKIERAASVVFWLVLPFRERNNRYNPLFSLKQQSGIIVYGIVVSNFQKKNFLFFSRYSFKTGSYKKKEFLFVFQEAENHFLTALELTPNSAEIYGNMGKNTVLNPPGGATPL